MHFHALNYLLVEINNQDFNYFENRIFLEHFYNKQHDYCYNFIVNTMQ